MNTRAASETLLLSPLQQWIQTRGTQGTPMCCAVIDCGTRAAEQVAAKWRSIASTWEVARLCFQGEECWIGAVVEASPLDGLPSQETLELEAALDAALEHARATAGQHDGARASTLSWRGRCWLILCMPSAAFDHVSAALLSRQLNEESPPLEDVIQYPDISPWMHKVCTPDVQDDSLRALMASDACMSLAMLDAVPAGSHRSRSTLGTPLNPSLQSLLESRLTGGDDDWRAFWACVLSAAIEPFAGGRPVPAAWLDGGRHVQALAHCPGRLAQLLPFSFRFERGADYASRLREARGQLRLLDPWRLRFDVERTWQALGGSAPLLTFSIDAAAPSASNVLRWEDDALGSALHVRVVRHGEPRIVVTFDRARHDAGGVRLLLARAAAIAESWLEPVQTRMRDSGPPSSAAALQPFSSPEDDRLLAQFDAQCVSAPDTIAVTDASGALTFGELNRQTATLARHFQSAGVRPGDRVVLHLASTRRQWLGVLSCLRIGATFVPTDLSWPADRIRWVASDCASSLTLSDADEVWHQLAHEAPEGFEGLAGFAAPANLPAALIYTSGSTGKPKGVLVTRANIASYVEGLHEALDLRTVRSMAALGSFAADLTHTALFGALCGGNELQLFERSEILDLSRLLDRLRHRPVDLLKTVPSLVPALLDADPSGAWLPRQYLVLGGERISESLLASLRRLSPPCAVVNHYGPTETTIGASLDVVDLQAPRLFGVGPSIIGKALSRFIGVDILDTSQQPVHDGIEGEIAIRGAGVTLGYLNDPRLTAARFLPDPLSCIPGARRYRSGDKARRLPDGRTEFLGRLDEQIKLRGFRTEPGEVEQTIQGVPGVAMAAVVVARDAENTPLALKAVYCGEIEPEVLSEACARLLPEHAVPSLFVRVEALPRLASGKIDRVASAALCAAVDSQVELATAPHVAAIATELGVVLCRAPLGADEDFLRAGGNSILALRACAGIERRLGVSVPAHLLLTHRTPRRLATEVGRRSVPAPTPGHEFVASGLVPLSSAQKRIWYASTLLAPAALNIPFVLDIEGTIDTERLLRAIHAVIKRHDVLRYRLVVDGASASARVAPEVMRISVEHAGDAAAAEVIAAEESRRPFDLAHESPIRIRLLRIHPQRHCLLVVLHHIAVDAWSHSIFLKEVARFYASDTVESQPLSIQYWHYAAAENERCTPDAVTAGMARWRDYLGEGHHGIDLSAGRRIGGQPRESRRLTRALSRDASQPMLRAAREAGVSPTHAFLGMFLLLLRKICGEDDLTIGIATTDRMSQNLQHLIGVFFQVLPFRLPVQRDGTLVELWTHVRDTLAGLWSLNQIPFGKVSDRIPRGTDPLQPWFNVVFAHREEEAELALSSALGSARVELRRPEILNGQYDLYFTTHLTARGLECVVEFKADVLSGDVLSEWITLFERMLILAGRPETRVRDVGGALPSNAAEPRLEIPARDSLNWIAANSSQYSSRIAASSQGLQLTYAELDGLSHRLAARLQQSGTPAGACVIVCIQRDATLPALILGILRSGNIYVPVDPALPPLRKRAIQEACNAQAIVTSRQTSHVQECFPGVPQFYAEDLLEGAGNPLSDVSRDPTHIAYLMFTSGSTGTPKGVAISLSELNHFLQAAAERLALQPSDTLLAQTTASFDISLLELLLPLYCGARVHVVPSDFWRDSDAVQRAMDEGVTAIQATPTLWPTLMNRLEGQRLRKALVGGESVSADLGRRLLAIAEEVWVMYGPTECTVWVSATAVNQTRLAAADPLPIGDALQYTTLRVVDVDRHEAPVGIPGEIVIEGALVGRGYWGDPALTQDRFQPAEDGSRVFFTGDRGVRLPGGELRFLGRAGGFIKLRGLRIEPEEIESLLLGDPRIVQARVLLTDEPADRQQLVACVVAEDHPSFDKDRWIAGTKERLAAFLPSAFHPARYVFFDSLPLTSSGKLDRRRCLAALPEETTTEPLRGALEAAVAGAFARVLRRPVQAAGADFFTLGGNSLLALELQSALQNAFGVELPLREIFEGATVEAIASRVEQRRGEASRPPARIPVHPDKAAPLSPQQRGIWIAEQAGHAGAAFHMQATFVMSHDVDVARLREAYRQTVGRHDQLRVGIEAVAGAPIQRLHDHVGEDFAVEHIAPAPEASLHSRVRARLDQWSREPFRLDRPGYSRMRVLRAGTCTYVTILIHHLVTDEWSWAPLLSDLHRFYGSPVDRSAPEPERLRYIDYASWFQSQANADWLARQEHFWKSQLADAPDLLELPRLRPRPAVLSMAGSAIDVRLPQELTGRLQAIADAHRQSLFSVIVAAYAWTLHRLSDQTPLVIGTATANRRAAELATVVGNFVNIVPLVVRFSPATNLAELLRGARDAVESALQNQELPFSRLVQALQRPPSRAYLPVVQNVVVFHNARPPHIPSASQPLELEAVRPRYTASQYDLDLGLHVEDNEIRGYLRFKTDLYDADEAARIRDDFIRRCAWLCDDTLRSLVAIEESGVTTPAGGASSLVL